MHSIVSIFYTINLFFKILFLYSKIYKYFLPLHHPHPLPPAALTLKPPIIIIIIIIIIKIVLTIMWSKHFGIIVLEYGRIAKNEPLNAL